MEQNGKDQFIGLEELEYLQKEHEIKRNIIGVGFIQAPRNNDIEDTDMNRVNVMGEIVSASGFEVENIFITYKLIVPDYWLLDGEKEFQHLQEELDTSELNKLSSSTQNSMKKLELNKSTGQLENHFYFGFLTDWQFIVDECSFIKKGPVLVMEISHNDSWGRYSLEGYTFCELPKTPGFHEIECVTWKPKKSAASEVFNFFLGGAVRAKNMNEIGSASFIQSEETESSMNMMTSKTVSSGKVKLRFNVCHQNASYMLIQRELKKEERHKQNRVKYQIKKERERLMGPELMTVEDGQYMGRFTKPT